jgi:mannosyltransferase
LYDDRYVLYSLAGAPLLAAAGAERVAGAAARLWAGGRRGSTFPSSRNHPNGVTRVAVRGDRPGVGGVTADGPPEFVPYGDGGMTGGPRVPAPAQPASLGGGVALRDAPRVDVPPARRTGRRPSPVRRHGVALLGALAVCGVFAVQLPLLRADRTAAHRPDDLAAVSAVVGREVRPGDPVLFLPSLERRSALSYPAGFRGVRDVALDVPAAADGTLYGREVGPAELRRRLAGLTYVWMVSEPFALRSSWTPWSSTERAKLAVLSEDFVIREEYVRRGITLRLYVRRDEPRVAGPAV